MKTPIWSFFPLVLSIINRLTALVLEKALQRLGRCAYLPLEEIRQSILESGEPHVINAPETLSFHPFVYTAEDIEKLQALATGEAG